MITLRGKPNRLLLLLAMLVLWTAPANAKEGKEGETEPAAAESQQDNTDEQATPAAVPSPARRMDDILRTLATAAEIPAELRDPAFDRYVDLTLLGKSWADLDAPLMADVALQFLEGERVLLRQHRAIGVDELLGFAIRLASVKHDSVTLSRLDKAIRPRGNEKLLAELEKAQNKAAKTRLDEPARMISIDALSESGFAFYKGCLQDIEAALVANDPAALNTVEKELPAIIELPEEHRAKLKKKIEDTRALLSATDQKPSIVAGILDKLAVTARNPFANPLPEGSGWLGGGTPSIPPDTTPPDTTPPGTIPPGTIPPGTIPPGTIPPGTIPPDTIPPDTIPPGIIPPGIIPPDTTPPDTTPPTYWPPRWPYYPPNQQQQQQQQWVPSKTYSTPQYYPKGKYSPPTKTYSPPKQYPPGQEIRQPEYPQTGYVGDWQPGWGAYPRRYYSAPR